MEATGTKPRRPTKTRKGGIAIEFKQDHVKVAAGSVLAHLDRVELQPSDPSNFTKMYLATPLERIVEIRKGVPARTLVVTGEEMGFTKEKMIFMLSFARATVNRRIKAKQPLPSEYSERIIGLQRLVGQVEVMVSQSGDSSGFNAAQWVADWLEHPVAALNNAKPAEFMDTIEGQEMVSSLLAKMQSGAYA